MESIEENKKEYAPKTADRDVWKEFQHYLHRGQVDKILELASFLREHGREEDAQKVINAANSINEEKSKEKSEPHVNETNNTD